MRNCIIIHPPACTTFDEIKKQQMKKILLAACCVIAIFSASAQTQDKKWAIGLHGGVSQYNGDLGNDFYKTNGTYYGFGGLSLSRYLGGNFDVNLLATKGTMGYRSNMGNFKNDFTSALLNFRFNILGPNSPVRPYLMVGGGAILFDKNLDIKDEKVDFIAPSFGGGINFKLGPSLMLNLQEVFMYSTADERDGVVGDRNDAYLLHTAGLAFNFGKKKDADNDGVADRLDKCPNTPTNTMVDKKGCPLDEDEDGIPDYLDACPDVAGTEMLKGCPDKDGDGIADQDDRCPEVAGTAALRGCPDADGDGVADIDDKCPGTTAGYKVDTTGCTLDNDKDGVVNEEDACPDLAGTLALKGCPDKDGDGVADNEDRCPDVAGTIANKGCPEVTVEDKTKITQIASKLFFENNSAKLKTASLNQLDELIVLLKKYETANLTIEGYTDDKGSDEFNLALSQKRTESVKNYLVEKQVSESRLKSTGMGETNPVADNKTAAGRARNRRVELQLTY